MYTSKVEGKKEGTPSQTIDCIAMEISLRGWPINHKCMSSVVMTRIHLSSSLDCIKVYFSVKKCVYSNLTLALGTWANAGREKGGNKYYKMQKHLSTLSKPVRANRN